MVTKFKLKPKIGDKTALMLHCLSGHFKGREVDKDKKLRPSACAGCDWASICSEVMTVIRVSVQDKYHT